MTTEAKLLKFQAPAARREALSRESQSEAQIAALLAAFCAHPRFLLTSHARPDGDAIGSALALAEVLDQLGCKVDVILADPIPSTYRALPNLHRIHRSLLGVGTPHRRPRAQSKPARPQYLSLQPRQ